MSNKIIKIGKKDVLLNDFKSAVANAKSYRDICRELYIKVSSTPTIKTNIAKYGLDASHLERYTNTDAVKRRIKEHERIPNISDDNEKYFVAFQNSFQNQKSWYTYKPNIVDFMEKLGDRDFATVKISELVEYARQGKNIAHIKSFITFLIKNNINNFYSKVDKSILAWIVCDSNLPSCLFEDITPSDNKLLITENKNSKGHNICQYCEKEFPATSDYWMLAQFSDDGEMFIACRECEGKNGKIVQSVST